MSESAESANDKFRSIDVPFFRGWSAQTISFAMGFAAHHTNTNLYGDDNQNVEFMERANRQADEFVAEAERFHGDPLNRSLFSMNIIEATFEHISEYICES